MPKSQDQSEWLGSGKAAAILSVSSRTLYRFIDEGLMTGYRFGRVIRVKRQDLMDFIEACRIVPGTLKHLYPDPKQDPEPGDLQSSGGNSDSSNGDGSNGGVSED